MLRTIGNYFKAPPDVPVIENKEEIDAKYRRFRIEAFTASFIGYTVFHLTKKNIGAALPELSTHLGYTNLQLGILGSSLYFTYAFGKFINGVIADKADAKKFLTAALFMSAVANIAFGLSPYIIPKDFMLFGQPLLLLAMALFWGINGWFQSMGFPAIAKVLAFWFSNTERGTKWALWSTSHQFGTMLGAVLAGTVIVHFGWQAAFIIPGVINLIMCIFTYATMHDKPTTLGLPEVEMYREGTLPTKDRDAKKIIQKSANYSFTDGILYKRSYNQLWLRCISTDEGDYILIKIHQGICRAREAADSLSRKADLQGYF